jgi:nucleotidyltransferase/DNA polymerase involved in DNA repair
VSSHRTIIHLDLDAFFCAVEEQRDPALRGKAFAVGGRPESRGVVSSASYAARQFGIHSAMPMSQAVRLIGVGVSGLGAPPRQLSLWDVPPAPTPEQLARQQRVEAALAAIQARFGAGAVRRGNDLGEP